MSNDERAAFEAWAHQDGLSAERPDGDYVSMITIWAWQAWQARAAIAQQPEAWGVETEDGAMLMVFLDRAEAATYCDGAEPVALGRIGGAAIAQPAEPVDWRLTAARFLRDEDAHRSHLGYANRAYELVFAAEKLEQLASASPYGLDCADPTLRAAQPAEPAQRIATMNAAMKQAAAQGADSLAQMDAAIAAAQADAQPVAPEFDHSIGEGRFRVEKGPFWWYILIGEGTAKVGKFHSKLAAEDVALKLLTAFRDGAYMQWQAAAHTQRQPLTEAQIQELCCAVDASGARPAATALIRAVERAHGIGEGEKP